MKFTKSEAWAVRQATDEMYAWGVSSLHYQAALRDTQYLKDGSIIIHEATVAGSQIANRACELLAAQSGSRFQPRR